MGYFDRQTLSLFCSQCRKDIYKPVPWLKREPHITCDTCGLDLTAQRDKLFAELAHVEKVLDEDLAAMQRGTFKP